jgi:hypothetical protein
VFPPTDFEKTSDCNELHAEHATDGNGDGPDPDRVAPDSTSVHQDVARDRHRDKIEASASSAEGSRDKDGDDEAAARVEPARAAFPAAEQVAGSERERASTPAAEQGAGQSDDRPQRSERAAQAMPQTAKWRALAQAAALLVRVGACAEAQQLLTALAADMQKEHDDEG